MKKSYLYYLTPSSLIHALPTKEFLFLSLLIEREGYLNKTKKGEWFSVPIIYLCNVFDIKKTSGSSKNLISKLREELLNKGLIEYQIGDVNNACKYRIIWKNIEKIAQFNSDFWITNGKESYQNWIDLEEKPSRTGTIRINNEVTNMNNEMMNDEIESKKKRSSKIEVMNYDKSSYKEIEKLSQNELEKTLNF